MLVNSFDIYWCYQMPDTELIMLSLSTHGFEFSSDLQFIGGSFV